MRRVYQHGIFRTIRYDVLLVLPLLLLPLSSVWILLRHLLLRGVPVAIGIAFGGVSSTVPIGIGRASGMVQ
jgi:hypothetical protein